MTHCVSGLLSRASGIQLKKMRSLPGPGLVSLDILQGDLAWLPLRMNEITTQLRHET